MKTFKELGLSSDLLKALDKKGYTAPTEIQEKTIPLLLSGEIDIIGHSQTGSGKTAAFALPIIQNVDLNSNHIQALILVPTRELALQVSKEFESLSGNKRIYSMPVYGGTSIMDQLKQLKRGVHVVVGTPGRTLDLIKRKALDVRSIKFAVLDEADEMLSMGFIEDIETILGSTNKNKQMLLFSATMPKQIMNITKKFMDHPEYIKVKREESATQIEEFYYNVATRDRIETINRIIDLNENFYGIIFCNTKATVDSVVKQLVASGY